MRVYNPIADHSRRLTVEICLAKLQEIDEEIREVTEPGKIARMWESRDWFSYHLERLQKKRGSRYLMPR